MEDEVLMEDIGPELNSDNERPDMPCGMQKGP